MNNTLIGIFSLLLTALVLQNAVFSRALDITSLLVLPGGRKGLRQFGLILTGITTAAALFAALLNPLISQWENVQYLRPVVYVLILTLLYGIVCFLLNWKKRDWFHDHSMLLTMAFFNCAAYGAMALTVYSGLHWLESTVYGLGIGLSFLLAIFLLEQGRHCMSICNIPKAFRGLPAELVYVGLISLSLYGLVGHQLAA